MDCFGMGLYSLFFCIQLIVFSVIVYKSFSYMKFIRNILRDEAVFQKRYFMQKLDENTSDLFEKMEDIKYDMMEIQKCVLSSLNNKVNWIDTKKKMPEAADLVLLKLTESGEECKGYLNLEKNGWILLNPRKGKYFFKMGEVSFWKPIMSI